ncbi:MAG: hypothetical protein SFY80_04480 [Verrucomicrobiota bacterium]|nr:hypothetical protein [Verrucomicrobiota bacterium]
MAKKSEESPAEIQRTWKDLSQSDGRRVSSQPARRRQLHLILNIIGGVTLIALVIVSAWGLIHLLRTAEAPGNTAANHPARQVTFDTDGVLTRDWFIKSFTTVSTDSLMSLDLRSLKLALEAHGQVLVADLKVQLPDQLVVTLKERQPAVRIRVAGTLRDSYDDRVVAEDGTVYKGQLYPKETLERLPYLTGLKLAKQGDGYARIPGMDTVADLLKLTRSRLPSLFRTFRTVSLEKFDGNPLAPEATIMIGGGFIDEIVFAPRAFEPQIERLTEMVNYAVQSKSNGLKRVDVSFDNKAFVQNRVAVPKVPAAKTKSGA